MQSFTYWSAHIYIWECNHLHRVASYDGPHRIGHTRDSRAYVIHRRVAMPHFCFSASLCTARCTAFGNHVEHISRRASSSASISASSSASSSASRPACSAASTDCSATPSAAASSANCAFRSIVANLWNRGRNPSHARTCVWCFEESAQHVYHVDAPDMGVALQLQHNVGPSPHAPTAM